MECLFRRSAWTNWRGLFDGFKTITGRRKLCLSLRRQFPHAPPKQLMSTVYAFYDYLSRHEEYRLRLSDKLTRTIMGSRRGFKDFLYHINRTRQYDTRVIRLIEPKKRIKTLKKSEVENLLSACLTTRDRFLIQLLWESGLRIGEALALWLEDIEPDAHRIHRQHIRLPPRFPLVH